MKNTSFWASTVIIIVVALGALFFLTGGTGTPNGDGSTALATPVTDKDHIVGSIDAPVVLVAYEDFQCSACALFYPMVKQMEKDFGEDLAFVFRNYPLQTLHPNGYISSQAAEAAGLQGKFWEMHDMLYENQTTWGPMSKDDAKKTFETFAQALNLDIEKFNDDLESDQVKDLVLEDIEGATADLKNRPRTPTLYLNGELLSFNTFEEAVEAVRIAVENSKINPSSQVLPLGTSEPQNTDAE